MPPHGTRLSGSPPVSRTLTAPSGPMRTAKGSPVGAIGIGRGGATMQMVHTNIGEPFVSTHSGE